MSLFGRIVRKLRPQTILAKVSIPKQEVEFVVEAPITVLEALRKNDIDIDHFCGGICSCGTCIVQAEGKLSSIHSREKLVLGYSRIGTHRLACQAKILGDVQIHLP